MFKLPSNLPIKSSAVEELTDFVEWECIKNTNVSIQVALKPLFYSSDELNVLGIEDDTDFLNNRLDDIAIEIDRRRVVTNNKYPFIKHRKGYRLSILSYNQYYWVYVYLLLSTRLNMLVYKVWRGIDGTEILEELSAIIAKCYFGDRA